MTEEQKQTDAVDVPKETEEQTGEAENKELSNVGEVNQENKSISVDLWGVTLDLPIDKAKQLIKERDNRSSAFKDLSEKVKEYEEMVETTQRRLQAAEKAKAGELAEAEQLFSKKAEETIQKYKSKVVRGAIVDELTRNEKFLDTNETRNDAIALIMAQNNLTLDSDDNISADGKNVKEIVNEFIESRAAFQKASRANSHSQIPKTIETKAAPSLRNGLDKFLNASA